MANESRKSRALRQQNPGMASTGRVDPAAGARARRAAAGEQAAGLRYRQGLRVQDDGSLEVHTDATLRVDQRQQLGVRNKFDTPTKDTQAANKAYVDAQIAQFGTAYRVQTDLEFDQLYSSPSGLITVPVVAGPGTTAVTSELDLGNLLAAGIDGISLRGGHSYIIRGGLSAISGNNNYHQGRFIAAVKNATSGVLTILLWRTVRTSQQNRTHWTVEAVYTATEDVEAVLLYQWEVTGSFRLAYPLLSAQRVAPYDEDNGPLPLPPLPDGFATISYNELTAVAWTDDLSLWGNGLPDSDTFTWTFDEWGPTYLDYSGAYGSPVSHRFMDGGTHTVQLTASGPSGSDTATVDVVVQDVFETQDLLNSTGVFAVSDYPSQTRVSSTGIAAIAAPDGTLTGDSIVGDTTGTAVCFYSMTPSTAGLGWQDGLAVSFSIYVYRPNMTGATGDYARFQLSLLGTAGYNNYIQWRCRANDEVFIFTASTPSSCSFTYTQERNLSYEEIGNTGWIKYTAVLWDFDRNMTSLQLSAERLGGDYELITWNPTLRYGDWVSRGKNRVTSGEDLLDPDWNVANATVTRSDEVTPAGTSSAVLVVPDAGASVMNLRGLTQGWENLGTAVGRVTLSAYFKDAGIGYAALGLTNNGGYHATATIDLSTGAATLGTHPSPASDLSSDYEDAGNGWKFCSFTMTLPLGTNQLATACFSGSTAPGYSPYARNITGDGTNGVHIWGARVTVGNPADMLDYFVSGPQNLLGDGSNYDPATSGWVTGARPRDVAVTTNTAVAPNGRLEADTLTHTDGQSPSDYITVSVLKTPAAEAVYYNFYYKIDPALPVATACHRAFFRLLAGGAQVESLNVYLAYGSDNPITFVAGTTTGGPGYTADDITVTRVSNDWVRVSIRLFDYSNTADNPRVLHYNTTPFGNGLDYDVTLWGSEITTITPKTPV